MTITYRPQVSVCIANYNGELFLRDCIDSVLSQDTNIDVEILVHDDASSDGSLALLDAEYPQVRVIRSTSNVGFCIANNRMAAQASGEYLLLLNNDAALHPDALATLLAAAQDQFPAAILTLPQYEWTNGRLVDRGCLLDIFYNPAPNLSPTRMDVAYVIGACLWIPRGIWNELGGFPEWMGSIAEDVYLCCMARLRQIPVAALPNSGFRHRQGATFGGSRINSSGLKTTIRRRQLSERNKTFALFVCTPGILAWALLPMHLALLLFEGAILCALNRKTEIFSRIYLNAPVALMRALPDLLKIRRHVQDSRRISILAYYRPFLWIPRKAIMFLRFGVPEISK